MAGKTTAQLVTTETEWPRGDKLDFEALARMNVRELGDIYHAGSVPYSLKALDGALRGRVLTMVGPGGHFPLVDVVRRVEAAERFPWQGKTFTAIDNDHGTGINRIRLLGGITRTWFPFKTYVGPSAIDGEPCICLDYDSDDNPWLVRKIRDELREVAPNVFLGPALLSTPTSPRLMMYFALTPAT